MERKLLTGTELVHVLCLYMTIVPSNSNVFNSYKAFSPTVRSSRRSKGELIKSKSSDFDDYENHKKHFPEVRVFLHIKLLKQGNESTESIENKLRRKSPIWEHIMSAFYKKGLGKKRDFLPSVGSVVP